MTTRDKKSDAITKGPARAPARAMLRATGFTDGDFAKPMIGVVNTFSTVTPCNMHLKDLMVPVCDGVRDAGAMPIEFNTIVVSDGITMGSEGMRASLISRENIADSIELAVTGHSLDGVIFKPHKCKERNNPRGGNGTGADECAGLGVLRWLYHAGHFAYAAGR